MRDAGRWSELRIPGIAAQTRMVSLARIRLVSRKSPRIFKRIICDDVSEFESHMPSHAVGFLCAFIPFMGFASSAVRFNGRARQQPSRLRSIFRSLGKTANLAGGVVRPHRNGLAHGKPLSLPS